MNDAFGSWGSGPTLYLCETHRINHYGVCPRCKREQEEKEANA